MAMRLGAYTVAWQTALYAGFHDFLFFLSSHCVAPASLELDMWNRMASKSWRSSCLLAQGAGDKDMHHHWPGFPGALRQTV